MEMIQMSDESNTYGSGTERELEMEEAIVRGDGISAVKDVKRSIETLSNSLEELAEDATRRGILPQTDSDQARLVTDGGTERQTALTSHVGREIAEPVRDDERNVRCPDCDQIVSASKGSHRAPDGTPTEKIWGWQCRICENTLPSNALREDAPTFNERMTAVRVAFRDGHERLVPAPKTHVIGGEST